MGNCPAQLPLIDNLVDLLIVEPGCSVLCLGEKEQPLEPATDVVPGPGAEDSPAPTRGRTEFVATETHPDLDRLNSVTTDFSRIDVSNE